jgi:signal transduction histidine kinase
MPGVCRACAEVCQRRQVRRGGGVSGMPPQNQMNAQRTEAPHSAEKLLAGAVRAVLDGHHSAVLVLGPDFRISASNAAAQHLFGAPAGLTGKLVDEIFKRTSDVIRCRHASAAASADQPQVSYQAVLAGEFATPVEATVGHHVLFETSGRSVNGHVLFINPTHGNAAAGASTDRDAALSALASGLAHDFNNALTVITGNVLAAHDTCEQAAVNQLLDRALAGCRFAASMVASIKMLSTHGVVQCVPLSLDVTLEQVRPMLSAVAAPTAQLHIAGTVAPAWILGDRPAIERIMLNVVTNAAEALAGRCDDEQRTRDIWVRVKVSADCQPSENSPALPHWVSIVVEDNGPGMPPAILSRALEPYFSTKAPISSSSAHHGIGLAVVRNLMTRMGGTVSVSSRLGEGTAVELTWPAIRLPASL